MQNSARRSTGSKRSRVLLFLFVVLVVTALLWSLLEIRGFWTYLALNRVPHTASVRGIVYDATTLQPLPNTTIEIGGQTIRSDASGSYQLHDLPASISEQGGGWYYAVFDLHATLDGYTPITRRLPVNYGSEQATMQLHHVDFYGDVLLLPKDSQPQPGYLSYYDYLYRTVVVDLAGQSPLPLIDNAYHPVISPDGKRIAYQPSTERGIWLFDVPARSGHAFAPALDPYNMSWSPDSRSIVAASRDVASAAQGLFVVDATSGLQRRLTSHPAGFQDEDPLWSPDGSRILFYRRQVLETASPGQQSSYLVPASGGDLQLVPVHGAWHPNGRWVAYLRPPDRTVHVVEVETGKVVEDLPLPDSPATLELVGWLPDGKHLVFEGVSLLGRAGAEDVYQHSIWIYATDRHVLYQLLPEGRGPRWTK